MVSSGLPELRSEEDLEYVKGALFLEKTEDEALSAFKELISECLQYEWTTHINWLFHNLKHK